MHLGRLTLLCIICSVSAVGNVSLIADCLQAYSGGQPQHRFFPQIPEPSSDATEELEALAADAAGEDLRCPLGICSDSHQIAWSVLRHRIGPRLYSSRDVTDVLHRFLI
jgi:hypothetical protein